MCSCYIWHRALILTLSTWLLLIFPTVSIQRCRPTFAVRDIKSFDDNMVMRYRCCCRPCTSSRIQITSNPLATLRSGIIRCRGGGTNSRNTGSRSRSDDDESNNINYIATTTRKSLPQLLSSKHGRRKACSFYIWNAHSALFHRWCHHLQRDNIYEGLGGKKVRAYQNVSQHTVVYRVSIRNSQRTVYSNASSIVCSYTTRIDAATIVSMYSL